MLRRGQKDPSGEAGTGHLQTDTQAEEQLEELGLAEGEENLSRFLPTMRNCAA